MKNRSSNNTRTRAEVIGACVTRVLTRLEADPPFEDYLLELAEDMEALVNWPATRSAQECVDAMLGYFDDSLSRGVW